MVDAATCGSPRSTGPWLNSRNTRATNHPRTPGWVKYSALDHIIDVTGREFAGSMTYRDVARAAQAAIVIDDLASTDPWRPRGIEIRGRAETVTEPHELIRIHPDRVIAWGLDE